MPATAQQPLPPESLHHHQLTCLRTYASSPACPCIQTVIQTSCVVSSLLLRSLSLASFEFSVSPFESTGRTLTGTVAGALLVSSERSCSLLPGIEMQSHENGIAIPFKPFKRWKLEWKMFYGYNSEVFEAKNPVNGTREQRVTRLVLTEGKGRLPLHSPHSILCFPHPTPSVQLLPVSKESLTKSTAMRSLPPIWALCWNQETHKKSPFHPFLMHLMEN